ncbi:hypothetical protein GCM10023085_37600 [Actinomadura viridis]
MSGCQRLCPGTDRVAEPGTAGGPGKRTTGGAAASVDVKADSFRGSMRSDKEILPDRLFRSRFGVLTVE